MLWYHAFFHICSVKLSLSPYIFLILTLYWASEVFAHPNFFLSFQNLEIQILFAPTFEVLSNLFKGVLN